MFGGERGVEREAVLWNDIGRGGDGDLVFGKDVGVAQESIAAFDIFDRDVVPDSQSSNGVTGTDLEGRERLGEAIEETTREPYAEAYLRRVQSWRWSKWARKQQRSRRLTYSESSVNRDAEMHEAFKPSSPPSRQAFSAKALDGVRRVRRCRHVV